MEFKVENRVIDVTGQKVEMIRDLTKKYANTFIYFDPPYYPVAKTKDGKISPYTLYNGNDFLPIDFLKLKERCDDLTKRGLPFILNNSDCEFIRFLFREYIIVEVDEPRGLKTGKGKKPKERCLIITNFKQKKDFMKSISQMNQVSS